MPLKLDLQYIHNDDLIPVDSYEGITIYVMNEEQHQARENKYRLERIERSKHGVQTSIN